MQENAPTVVTVPLTALPQLIYLYGSEAPVDVRELLSLTVRALTAGLDYEYAYRIHGMYTDVDHDILKDLLRRIYNEIQEVLLSLGWYIIYDIDILDISINTVVLLVSY